MQFSEKGSFAELRQHFNTANQEPLDFQNEYGNTALIWQHAECVEFLLQEGASVDHQNEYGDTALIWVAREGYVECV